ncbi:conserved hypothetical protein [Arthrobacter sp. 9V]|uniref:hypothetical protein n=1 Tax=Arthrobacter sp. 9V TaxID=2653132 RepID=UPI0012F2373F|nr:hypothetical protein [Arthrobacter sp. 9V]VXB92281.1 conserved hypothetical protein [Arthrobacter sp. 9V]
MTAQTASEIAVEPTAEPTTVPRLQGPSVHMRALITWLAIFPLVSVGMLLLGPVMEPLHPVLRALVLTAFVVPTAVYLVVPRLMAGHGALTRKAVERAAQRAARKSA